MGDLTSTVDADASNPGESVKSFGMKAVTTGLTGFAMLLGWKFIAKPGEQVVSDASQNSAVSQIEETWGDA